MLNDSDSIMRGHYKAGSERRRHVLSRLDPTWRRSSTMLENPPRHRHSPPLRRRGSAGAAIQFLVPSIRGNGLAQPRSEHRVIKELVHRWAMREADSKWLMVRMDVASQFASTNALQPLALRLVDTPPHPHVSGSWSEFAILTVPDAQERGSAISCPFLEGRGRSVGNSCRGHVGQAPDPQLLHVVDPQLRTRLGRHRGA